MLLHVESLNSGNPILIPMCTEPPEVMVIRSSGVNSLKTLLTISPSIPSPLRRMTRILHVVSKHQSISLETFVAFRHSQLW